MMELKATISSADNGRVGGLPHEHLGFSGLQEQPADGKEKEHQPHICSHVNSEANRQYGTLRFILGTCYMSGAVFRHPNPTVVPLLPD
ncbi:hypothetical protein NQZ68_024355 [Dissostichus eleginoides]|nr:hypothetical protein NQZ68_024355 [Dissostichus eleginoides]